MFKKNLSLILILCIFFPFGCSKKENITDVPLLIEGIEYRGDLLAFGPKVKVFDFIFIHFYQEGGLVDSFYKAYQYSSLYEYAKESHSLSEEEREEIISLSQSYRKDDILYSDFVFESQDQYCIFMLMENTIHKYKKDFFSSLDLKETDLKKHYDDNYESYKEISLQILFMPIIGEEELAIKRDYLSVKMKEITNSQDMDFLIKEELGDLFPSEGGGFTSFILGDYPQKDDVVYAFASEPKIKEGDMDLVTDDYGLYLLRCDDIEDYDNNGQIKDKVREDLLNIKLYEKSKEIVELDPFKLEETDWERLELFYEKARILWKEKGIQ